LPLRRDNVGLLVDAVAHHAGGKYVILLTNDLTPKVLDEAIERSANLIVTYHPTPFTALKRFSLDSVAARTVLLAARHGMAVYSPHTALDSVRGGINDWLLAGIVRVVLPTGAPLPTLSPIEPADDPALAATGAGTGRTTTLAESVPLARIIEAVKTSLRLPHVQLALPGSLLADAAAGSEAALAAAEGVQVASVAVCAGSGGSVLRGGQADVLVTGEMSHHEVLAAVAAGSSVILTHHSKCERGYLADVLAGRLAAADSDFSVIVSCFDADPLVIV
jgi:dinuclear metal center YbgI/SA1388 family protein